MKHRKKAFTLIELIIVVVIIGILALVAIPRYFANVTKAQKNAVYANLGLIREAALAYYAIHNIYPADTTFPIIVSIEGETIVNLNYPSDTKWIYQYGTSPATFGPNRLALAVYKADGSHCYCVRLLSGARETSIGCCGNPL